DRAWRARPRLPGPPREVSSQPAHVAGPPCVTGDPLPRLLAADVLLAAGKRSALAGHCPARAASATRAARGRGSAARIYLLLTYFSRRICGTASPASFSASKQVSTMFGLPQR